MPVRHLLSCGVVPALLLAQACGDCAGVGQAGLVVTVRDIATGKPTGTTPSLRVTEGAHVEFYAAPQNTATGTFRAANDRAGVYTVLVLADGYEAYARDAVTVGRERKCGDIIPVALDVQLRRLSP